MGNILSGLKKLYAAMGGTDNVGTIKSTGKMIDKISTVAGGPYELPIASADTLGGVKVGSGLAITSDGTLSASGGGAGGALVLHAVTTEGEGHTTHALDKTAGEIVEAVEAGVPVMYYHSVSDGTGTYHVIYTLADYSYGPGENSDYGYGFSFFSPTLAADNQSQIMLLGFSTAEASPEAAAAAYPSYTVGSGEE